MTDPVSAKTVTRDQLAEALEVAGVDWTGTCQVDEHHDTKFAALVWDALPDPGPRAVGPRRGA